MSQIANVASRIQTIFRQSQTISSAASLWPDRFKHEFAQANHRGVSGKSDQLIHLCSDATAIRRYLETLTPDERELFTSYFLKETSASSIARKQHVPLWRMYENLHSLAEEMLLFLQRQNKKPLRDQHTGRFTKPKITSKHRTR